MTVLHMVYCTLHFEFALLKKAKKKKDEANGENELLAYPTFSHFSILLTFFKSVSFKCDA